MPVKPIPDGYHTVTPYLTVKNVAAEIEYLEKAFGAQETHRMTMPDGTVMHAEVQIGDSRVMLGEARGDWQPMPAMLYLYVEDTDATYQRAMAVGGKSLREPTNEFYGDRSAGVQDAAGIMWWIATHVEDVPAEELTRRAMAQGKK
jgi:PhnB protein